MQEVKIKDNVLDISIFFESKPNFSLIPESSLNLLMQDLEKEISVCVEKRDKRKKYQNKEKSQKNDKIDNHPP